MVAVKALAGSTPLAWVKVATARFVTFFAELIIDPDTTIEGSATAVVAEALLLAELGSPALLVTEAELTRLPSSSALPVIVNVALPPERIVPTVNVTTPPDCENVPWLAVAETYPRFAP